MYDVLGRDVFRFCCCRYLVINGGTRFPSQFLAAFDLVIGYESTGAYHENTMLDLHACCEHSVRVSPAPESVCDPERAPSSSLQPPTGAMATTMASVPSQSSPRVAMMATARARGRVTFAASTAGVSQQVSQQPGHGVQGIVSTGACSAGCISQARCSRSCWAKVTLQPHDLPQLFRLLQASQEGPGSCTGLLSVVRHL